MSEQAIVMTEIGIPGRTPSYSSLEYRFVRMPTFEECDTNAALLVCGMPARAILYPQVGGYWRNAVLVNDKGCSDVYVWMDGDGEPPTLFHYCDIEQFIQFVATVTRLMDELGMAVS